MIKTFNAILFSKDLKIKRIIDRNIDLRKAAKEIDISFSTLSRLENEKTPDLITYHKCCNWLGNDMNKYFTQTTNKTNNK